MGVGHKQAHSLQDQAHLDFRPPPKESRDMNYPLWTRLYMFVVGVANPKDGTLQLVTLTSRILVAHLT